MELHEGRLAIVWNLNQRNGWGEFRTRGGEAFNEVEFRTNAGILTPVRKVYDFKKVD